MLIRLITIWICNFIDIISTLYFYNYYGGIETNPLTAELVKHPVLFVIVKLTIITMAVAFTWWRQDMKFCKVASWILFVEYLAVAFYYFILSMVV